MHGLRYLSVGVAALVLQNVVGCGSLPPREEPPVDCAAGDAYEFDPISEGSIFEDPEMDPSWFTGTDGTGLVLCDSLAALLPDDMTAEEVAEEINPLVIDARLLEADVPDRSLLCEPRVLCNSAYAIVPEGTPDAERERTLCESTLSRRAQANYELASLEDGPRCGSEYALRLTAERNNDWGCLFGDWSLAQDTDDRTGWDGIALWARAAPGTTKSVLVLLNDKYTGNITTEDEDGNAVPDPNHESACVEEEDLGPGQGTTVNQVTGQQGSTSVNVSGRVPSEDACGNSYQKLLTVTERWQLYFLPFDSFTQDQLPNRRIEGIDTSSLRGLIIRAPKAAKLDLWIDDLSYYRALD